MGIPRLTGFILYNFTEWKYVNVRNERLVIDGSSLCYNLYFQHYQWEMGGEYCEFYSTVLEYCHYLRSLGIEAYIVMDGIDFDDSKRATHEERCKQKFDTMGAMQSKGKTQDCVLLPLFAKAVFQDAVRDSGMKFFVADGEADPSIVALANHLQCPVFSYDSDFFIFEIQHGCIPIIDCTPITDSHTDITGNRNLVDLSSRVKCFRLDIFKKKFGLRGEKRLFLPLILGNDFHNGCSFPCLGVDSSTAVYKIIAIITESLHTDADVRHYGGESALKQMKKIRTYYCNSVASQSFADLSSSRALGAAFSFVPSWILDHYKQGKFSKNALHIVLSESKVWRFLVVVDDMSKSSAWKITMSSKRYIIGVLSKLLKDESDVLSNTDRCKDSYNLRTSKFVLKDKHRIGFSLEKMPSWVKKERLEILIKAFDCKDIESPLNDILDCLKLAVIACRAWLKKDKENFEHLVLPLVFCILSCSDKLPMPKTTHCRDVPDLNRLHSFAQWQCMLFNVITLNQLLYDPFPYTSPAKLFSSSVVEHYIQHPPPFPMEKLPSLMISVITKL